MGQSNFYEQWMHEYLWGNPDQQPQGDAGGNVVTPNFDVPSKTKTENFDVQDPYAGFRDPAKLAALDAQAQQAGMGAPNQPAPQTIPMQQPANLQPQVAPGDVPLIGDLAKFISPSDPTRAPIVGGFVKAISDITKPTDPALTQSLPDLLPGLFSALDDPNANLLDKAGAVGNTALSGLTGAVGALTGAIRDAPVLGGLYRAAWEAPMNVLNEATIPVGGALNLTGELLGRGITDVAGMYGAKGGVEGLYGQGSRVQELFAKATEDARKSAHGNALSPVDYMSGSFEAADPLRQVFLSFVNPVNVIDVYPLGGLQKLRGEVRATGRLVIPETKAFGKVLTPQIIKTAEDAPLAVRLLFDMPKVEKTVDGAVKLAGDKYLGLEQTNWMQKLIPTRMSNNARAYEMLRRTLDNFDTYMVDRNAEDFAKFLGEAVNSAKSGYMEKAFFGKYPGMLSKDAQVAIKMTGEFDVDGALEIAQKQAEAVRAAIQEGKPLAKNAPEIFKRVYEGLRKNPQDTEKVLDTATKYYLRLKWGDHVANSIKTTLGITDVGTVKRMFNSLKAWEGAMYIGMNPGSWVRNGINNKATIALYGINPFSDWKKVAETYKAIGWDPFKEMDEMTKMKMVKGAEGASSTFGATIPKEISKLFPFMQNMENSDRRLAYWSGFHTSRTLNWRRGNWFSRMPAGLERDLKAINPRLPDLIYGAIEAGFSREQIYENVHNLFNAIKVQAFMENPDFLREMETALRGQGLRSEAARGILKDLYEPLNKTIETALKRRDVPRAQALQEELGKLLDQFQNHHTTLRENEAPGFRDAAHQAAHANDPEFDNIVEQQRANGARPYGVTPRMKKELADLGWSDEQIADMIPDEAIDHIRSQTRAPIEGQPPQAQAAPTLKTPEEHLRDLEGQRAKLVGQLNEVMYKGGKQAQAKTEELVNQLDEIEKQIDELMNAQEAAQPAPTAAPFEQRYPIGAKIEYDNPEAITFGSSPRTTGEIVGYKKDPITGQMMAEVKTGELGRGTQNRQFVGDIHNPRTISNYSPDRELNNAPTASSGVDSAALMDMLKNAAPQTLEFDAARADEAIKANTRLNKDQKMQLLMQPPEVRVDYMKSAYKDSRHFEEELKSAQAAAARVTEKANAPTNTRAVLDDLQAQGVDVTPQTEARVDNALKNGESPERVADLERAAQYVEASKNINVYDPADNPYLTPDTPRSPLTDEGMKRLFEEEEKLGRPLTPDEVQEVLARPPTPESPNVGGAPVTESAATEISDQERLANITQRAINLAYDEKSKVLQKSNPQIYDELWSIADGLPQKNIEKYLTGQTSLSNLQRGYDEVVTKRIEEMAKTLDEAEKAMRDGGVIAPTMDEILNYMAEQEPADLPTNQLTERQKAGLRYLESLKDANGKPLYQPRTWKPEFLDKVLGGAEFGDMGFNLPKDLELPYAMLETTDVPVADLYGGKLKRADVMRELAARDVPIFLQESDAFKPTRDDLLSYAEGRGVTVATKEGKPVDRNLLAVLNNWRPYDAKAFTMEELARDPLRRMDAWNVLTEYIPRKRRMELGYADLTRGDFWDQARRAFRNLSEEQFNATQDVTDLWAASVAKSKGWLTSDGMPDLDEAYRRIFGAAEPGKADGGLQQVGRNAYEMKNANGNTVRAQLGDSRKVLSQMVKEGKKVDAVVLDPPYYSKRIFGEWHQNKDWKFMMPDEFSDVAKSVSQIVNSDNSHVYLMLSGSPTAQADMNKYVAAMEAAGFKIVDEGSYTRTFKDGRPTTTPIGTQAPPERLILMTKSGKAGADVNLDVTAKRPPLSEYKTQKPVALLDTLIQQSVPENGTVLDPFAGSGITGASALKNNRNAILIDANPESIQRSVRLNLDKAINTPDALFQGLGSDTKELGSTKFLPDGRAIIRAATESHNASTAIHEISHAFLPWIPDDEMRVFENWTGLSEGEFFTLHQRYVRGELNLTTKEGIRYSKAQEQWARGFEQYLREGTAPTPELKALFDRFAQFLRNIYDRILGDKPLQELNDEMRGLYDRLLNAENYMTPDELAKYQEGELTRLQMENAASGASMSKEFFTQYFETKGGVVQARTVWYLPDNLRKQGQKPYRWGGQRPAGQGWRRAPWTDVTGASDEVVEQAMQSGLLTRENSGDDVMALAEKFWATENTPEARAMRIQRQDEALKKGRETAARNRAAKKAEKERARIQAEEDAALADVKPLSQENRQFAEGLAKKYGAPVAPVVPATEPYESLSRFSDMLERAADKSTDAAELAAILEKASGSTSESRIAWAILNNPYADAQTFAKAQSNSALRGSASDESISRLAVRRAELRKQRGLDVESPAPLTNSEDILAEMMRRISGEQPKEPNAPAPDTTETIIRRDIPQEKRPVQNVQPDTTIRTPDAAPQTPSASGQVLGSLLDQLKAEKAKREAARASGNGLKQMDFGLLSDDELDTLIGRIEDGMSGKMTTDDAVDSILNDFGHVFPDLRDQWNKIKGAKQASAPVPQAPTPQKPVSVSELVRQRMDAQKRLDAGDTAAQAELDALDAQFKTESQKIQDAAKNPLTEQSINDTMTHMNTGYHSGDGKIAAEMLNRQDGLRGTGHFGSGTYFFSSEEKAGKYQPNKEQRAVTPIDLSGKNMFKPRDFQQGIDLHDALKRLNNTRFENGKFEMAGFVAETIADRLKRIGVNVTEDDVMRAIESANKDIAAAKGNRYLKADSISTRLMRGAGYDGVDVRHIPDLDNSTYGSVLYTEKQPEFPNPEGQTLIERMEEPNAKPETRPIASNADASPTVAQVEAGRQPPTELRPVEQGGATRGSGVIEGVYEDANGVRYISSDRFPVPDQYVTEQKLNDILAKTGGQWTFMEHQVDNADRALTAFSKGKGFVIADATGTGKTYSGTLVADMMFDQGAKRIVLVAPPGVHPQWEEVMSPIGINFKRVGGNFVMPENPPARTVYVASYEGMTKWDLKKVFGKNGLDMVMFDESHKLKNLVTGSKPSQQAKQGVALQKLSDHALLMSATPIESVLHYAYMSDALGERFQTTLNKLGISKKYNEALGHNVWEGLSPQKLAELHNTLVADGKYVRHEMSFKAIYNKKTGELQHAYARSVPVAVTADDAQKYQRLMKVIDSVIADYGFQRNLEGFRVGLGKALLEQSKMDTAIEIARQKLAEGKSVAFFTFRKSESDWDRLYREASGKKMEEALQALYSKLKAAGVNLDSPVDRLVKEFPDAIKITGDETAGGELRAMNTKAFQDGEARVAVVTQAAGGTGLSLHDKLGDFPRVQINLTIPYTAMQTDQLAGRTFRMGSQSNAELYWLYSDMPLEAKYARRTMTRMKEMGALVQGEESFAPEKEMLEFLFNDAEAKQGSEIPRELQATVNVQDLKNLLTPPWERSDYVPEYAQQMTKPSGATLPQRIGRDPNTPPPPSAVKGLTESAPQAKPIARDFVRASDGRIRLKFDYETEYKPMPDADKTALKKEYRYDGNLKAWISKTPDSPVAQELAQRFGFTDPNAPKLSTADLIDMTDEELMRQSAVPQNAEMKRAIDEELAWRKEREQKRTQDQADLTARGTALKETHAALLPKIQEQLRAGKQIQVPTYTHVYTVNSPDNIRTSGSAIQISMGRDKWINLTEPQVEDLAKRLGITDPNAPQTFAADSPDLINAIENSTTKGNYPAPTPAPRQAEKPKYFYRGGDIYEVYKWDGDIPTLKHTNGDLQGVTDISQWRPATAEDFDMLIQAYAGKKRDSAIQKANKLSEWQNQFLSAGNNGISTPISRGDIVRYNGKQVEVQSVNPDGSLSLVMGKNANGTPKLEMTTPRKVERVAAQEQMFNDATVAKPQDNTLTLQSQEGAANASAPARETKWGGPESGKIPVGTKVRVGEIRPEWQKYEIREEGVSPEGSEFYVDRSNGWVITGGDRKGNRGFVDGRQRNIYIVNEDIPSETQPNLFASEAPQFGQTQKKFDVPSQTQPTDGQNALFQMDMSNEAEDVPGATGYNAADAADSDVQTLRALMPLIQKYVMDAADSGPVVLDPLTAKALRGYIDGEVTNSLQDARLASNVVGRWNMDRTVLNYDAKTNFDEWMSYVFPFLYWRRAQAWNWAQRFMEKPQLLSAYVRSQQALEDATNSDEYPTRLKGKLKMPMPFMEPWMGGDVFFDPLEAFMPMKAIYGAELERSKYTNAGNAMFALPASDDDVAKLLRSRAARGELNRNEVENAIATKTGDLWAQAKSEAQADVASPDNLTSLFTPHTPFQWAMAMLTNQTDAIGPLLPISRPIRQITGGMGMNGGEGINIESPVRNLLRAVGMSDLPEFDPYEEYRVRRMLANMVADGDIDEKTAKLAMIQKSGDAWAEASKRANMERVPLFSSFVAAQTYPTGERDIRTAQAQLRQLKAQEVKKLGYDPNNMTYDQMEQVLESNDAYAKGKPIKTFLDNNPALGARSSVFKQPEERLKLWMRDEIWQRYNEASALDKRAIRANLGKDFQTYFFSSETRDYDKIELLDMIRAGQVLDAIVPVAPKGEIQALDLANMEARKVMQFAPPETAKKYTEFSTLMKETFDETQMFALSDEYHKLTDAKAKNAFMAANPDYQAYTKAWTAFYDKNPDVKAFLSQYNDPSQATLPGASQSQGAQFYNAAIAAGIDWNDAKAKQEIYSALPKGTGARSKFLNDPANANYLRYYNLRNAFFVNEDDGTSTGGTSSTSAKSTKKQWDPNEFINPRDPKPAYPNRIYELKWGTPDMYKALAESRRRYYERQAQQQDNGKNLPYFKMPRIG